MCVLQVRRADERDAEFMARFRPSAARPLSPQRARDRR